ncbi:5-formyltetrahydrofolate cyclo-ligase isoform X2 [Phymastichus coffea]|uniref:5-formyltetrahydrofolate cyclo-ligase isoform X2 n=1 Tax=Phymastichus coffea TaxID=108790 RepID=UPI00273B1F71|nr:5-formyltetrahydrofolate cyclo-ligase isoform X2 [Phymastichus coffea]
MFGKEILFLYQVLGKCKFLASLLVSLPQYKASHRISLYLSIPNEVDTIPILKDMFAKGKEAFVPRYHGQKMEMVKINSMEDYHKLPLTKWNIKQPSVNEIRENALDNGGLDLVILPGMAFTKNGKRLGHGMGYYDKYLHMITRCQNKKPYTIAVAFNEQLHEDIPTNEQDFILDAILTDKF